jgi:hypothetical protein
MAFPAVHTGDRITIVATSFAWTRSEFKLKVPDVKVQWYETPRPAGTNPAPEIVMTSPPVELPSSGPIETQLST